MIKYVRSEIALVALSKGLRFAHENYEAACLTCVFRESRG